MCSVFWLFWLSYQYLPSDWLERLVSGQLAEIEIVTEIDIRLFWHTDVSFW